MDLVQTNIGTQYEILFTFRENFFVQIERKSSVLRYIDLAK